VAIVANHVEESLVALHQWKFLSGENRKQVEAKRHAGNDAFRRILGDGINSGIFKPVPNLDITIAGILGTLNSVAEWYSPKGRSSPEEIGEQLADLLLGGLLVPPTPPRAKTRATGARGAR
jgi:TetR/AcrR family transcriptional regulator, cholesterol catabolism regulator